MAEQIDLAAPVGPTTNRWRVYSIHLERGVMSDGDNLVLNTTRSFIEVVLVGDNGRTFVHRWTGQAADNNILALNKADLSTNSLERRVLAKLITDGVISGAVAGTPD